jgi:hypothetical protein
MSTEVHEGSLVKSQLLYQLSYAGAALIVFAESSSTCRRRHRRPPALLSKLLSNLERGSRANSRTSRNLRCHLTPAADSIAPSSGSILRRIFGPGGSSRDSPVAGEP